MSKTINISEKSNKKGTAIVEAVIGKSKVEEIKQKVLKTLGKKVSVKGFRKGKAPLELIEKQLDPGKVSEQMANEMLPEVVKEALKKFSYTLMGTPRAKLLGIKDGGWQFKLSFPLLPTIKLGDYKKFLKDEQATASIWKPGDDKEQEKPTEQSKEQKMEKMFTALLKKFDFEIPESLVEDEVNKSLSRLLDQAQRLGMGIEDYLKSTGKTMEQLREQYGSAARENLKLEVLLNKIGEDLKMKASDKEIDEMIASVGDEKTKKALNTPEQRWYIGSIISKRKTIDELLKL